LVSSNLSAAQQSYTDFTPRIIVIGVGGGGTNAVDNMIAANLRGVDFVVANTDAQQLMHSKCDRRVQLGPHLTQGLGAGARPDVGRAAAEEAADELYRHLEGSHMIFITAGMGGGTGTGAAPVIARMAKELGILTVGVVTRPFDFEGTRRARAAEDGILDLRQYVDTLIVIPNQNLFNMANERTTWKEAFKMADQVLYMGVRGVTDLMMVHGQVNLDFNDIRTVMSEMGNAMMGTGEADGEDRARRAAETAINNPLLEETGMASARGLLINITGGDDLTLFEVDHAVSTVRAQLDEDANILFGSTTDPELQGRIRVSVVATGIIHPRCQAPPRLVAVDGGRKSETHPMPLVKDVRPDGLSTRARETAAPVVTPIPEQLAPAEPAVMPDPLPQPDEPIVARLARQSGTPALVTEPEHDAPRSIGTSAAKQSDSCLSHQSGSTRGDAAPSLGWRSLLRAVTGLFRRPAVHEADPAPERRVEPTLTQANQAAAPSADPSGEPARAAADAAKIDQPSWLEVPAFLRRQSSTIVSHDAIDERNGAFDGSERGSPFPDYARSIVMPIIRPSAIIGKGLAIPSVPTSENVK
jgi:cell division protein FtsZ